jgi:hypothetical protein
VIKLNPVRSHLNFFVMYKNQIPIPIYIMIVVIKNPCVMPHVYRSNITHTSPATTKHPTIIVTITGIVFHRIKSFGDTVKPFCRRMLRQSRPASDAEKLGVSPRSVQAKISLTRRSMHQSSILQPTQIPIHTVPEEKRHRHYSLARSGVHLISDTSSGKG